jgi:hypothetical protein
MLLTDGADVKKNEHIRGKTGLQQLTMVTGKNLRK